MNRVTKKRTLVALYLSNVAAHAATLLFIDSFPSIPWLGFASFSMWVLLYIAQAAFFIGIVVNALPSGERRIWPIACWFTPFLNLGVPYLIVREIFETQNEPTTVVSIWWVTKLVTLLLFPAMAFVNELILVHLICSALRFALASDVATVLLQRASRIDIDAAVEDFS